MRVIIEKVNTEAYSEATTKRLIGKNAGEERLSV